MDRATCEAELGRRKVSFVRGEDTKGVLAPVRLRGPLSGGVAIHSQLPAASRDRAAMEIFDCRLVLALDDFSLALQKRGITEMIHLSAYRSRASFGCTPKYDGKQHCGALAVDIATFKRADGTSLDVLHDFRGHIGAPTCVSPASEIEHIVCDAADHATFNVILTPNFNVELRETAVVKRRKLLPRAVALVGIFAVFCILALRDRRAGWAVLPASLIVWLTCQKRDKKRGRKEDRQFFLTPHQPLRKANK